MATIPTLLYYFALFLMVEIDARKFGMSEVRFANVESLWSLTKQYWFSLPVAGVDHRVHALRYSPVLSVVLGDGDRARDELPAPPDTALFSYDLFRGREPLVRGSSSRSSSRRSRAGSIGVLNGRGPSRRRRDHRRGGDAHRPSASS